ncbi:Ycf66 family protein [Chamaesiphon minutus]|uniref:Ycf66 protein n=1 Tax=Chamaesiphon minutus (strain ATCC 27169 / PCC 6605) TaxID=1173020 RepID=K9UAB7_CHAP6|nr:Ycf66 family protein [Chamaesiphon minutus]AFY92062.1 Ycf66 protein [Chamaesiphon minutus PCC 6605]
MSFGIPAALLFGLVLILASLSLFLTSKFKPDLYQESDNIYAIVGIICGLLLLISLDLGAAMAFQQLLMIGSIITLMWQFIQVRAENKRLKGGGRSAGREASPRKSGYTARIDDEPEYAPVERSNRRNKDRLDRRNNEREDLEEFPSRRSATRELPEDRFAQTAPRRRLTEPARSEVGYLARRQNDSWDEQDWNDADEPVQVRRALPDADYASSNRRSSNRSRNNRPDSAEPTRDWDDSQPDMGMIDEPAPSPRSRRRSRPERDPNGSADRVASIGGEGSTANYIDYEPLDPPSGLPPSSTEPIVFPDRY